MVHREERVISRLKRVAAILPGYAAPRTLCWTPELQRCRGTGRASRGEDLPAFVSAAIPLVQKTGRRPNAKRQISPL